MIRSVEGYDLGYGRQHMLDCTDTEEVGGIVERSEIAADLDLGDDILIDDGAAGEEVGSLDDAMAYGLDVVEGRKHAVDRVHEGVHDKLHSDLVVRDGDFLHHPVLAGGAVGDASAGKAYLFDDTLGEEIVNVIALHVQKLVLDGRASAVNYKNDHIYWLLIIFSGLQS